MKKNFILTLLFFITTFNLFAQVIEWQNTIGGSSSDELRSISPTADGGYICGGLSFSPISGDKTENGMGGGDYWIVKLDSLGNIQWQNTIGGNQGDMLTAICQTSDGGYVCGGYSGSGVSGDKTEICQGLTDYWVIKLDAVGNIQWQNTIGGGAYDYLYCLAATSDGGCICGGTSNSPISGDKTEVCQGMNDYWIIKLDAAGNIQWQNTIGGAMTDDLFSIAQTSDGGYLCGGNSESPISGDKTEPSYGIIADYWIVKLDASGNIQWQNTIGGNNFEEIHAVFEATDGNYICAGTSASQVTVDKSEPCHGYCDFWILKLDTAGNIIWQNTIGGAAADWLQAASKTAGGGCVCGGYSNSNISFDKTENSRGDDDYWMVALDSAGNILYQSTIGGDTIDQLYSMAAVGNGEFICGGISLSNISGDKTENCIGGNDYWVVKLTSRFNFINGNLFADLNSNSVQDSGEVNVVAHRINELNTGRFTYSMPDGNYNLVVVDSGNFSVAPDALPYYNLVPVQHSVYFPSLFLTDSLNDFAFQPAVAINDLCVSITPPPAFRPGHNATYQIHYVNAGTTVLTPTIIFRKNTFLSYLSSSVTPSGIATDSIFWNLPAVSPLQQGTITLTLYVDTNAPIGSPVTCYAIIEPIIGDANPGCNIGPWEPPLFVTNSCDPNAIVVNLDTLTTTELASAPFLQYIIYFQNTGNDTAFTVRVENVLPTSLDASALELVDMSHPCNIQYDPLTRKVTFRFDNILLPDSNIDEVASHGYIHYRIKPFTTLMVGDTIQNTAAIYFDYNAAVVTNTAQTHIILITDVEKYEDNNSVLIYPNPARDELIVRSSDLPAGQAGFGDNAEIIIYNLLGENILSQKLKANSQQVINVSALPRGIYFIKVRLEEKIVLKKIVLM